MEGEYDFLFKIVLIGWWETFVGPGAPLDTNKFNIICCNVIGGCYGSSGPSSINPTSGKAYGTTFPLVTVEDMVRSQFLLMDHLGIQQLHAVVGSSLGAMQGLFAAAFFPERVGRLVSISGCARANPTSIAMRFVQRRILMSDPNWHGGHYYGKAVPVIGMQHARELGMIAYRSGPEWEMRFGHERAEPEKTPDFCPDFLVETYLEHHGEKFASGYDANSFLYISKAMDLFNIGDGFESVTHGLSRVKCPALVLGVTTDILFPIQQQRDLAEMLKDSGNTKVTFYEINSIYGHDSFLIDLNNVGAAVKGHLEFASDN